MPNRKKKGPQGKQVVLSLGQFEQQAKEKKQSIAGDSTKDLQSILDPFNQQQNQVKQAKQVNNSSCSQSKKQDDDFPTLGGPKKTDQPAIEYNFKPKDPYGLEIPVNQHFKKSEAPNHQPKKKRTNLPKLEDENANNQEIVKQSSFENQVKNKHSVNKGKQQNNSTQNQQSTIGEEISNEKTEQNQKQTVQQMEQQQEDQSIDEGFQVQETRAQKKDRLKQEQLDARYSQAAENIKKGMQARGRGRGRGRGQITFIPQNKDKKDKQDSAADKAAELMDKQYNEMQKEASKNGVNGSNFMPKPMVPGMPPPPLMAPFSQQLGQPPPPLPVVAAPMANSNMSTQASPYMQMTSQSSQPNSIFSTGGYPMNDNVQSNQEQPQVQPQVNEAPKDFASMMKRFEDTTIKEKENQQFEDHYSMDAPNYPFYQNQFDPYQQQQQPHFFQPNNQMPQPQMYGNNFGDSQNLLNSLQQDPSAFANMISQLTQNPDIQNQFGQQNVGLLQNFASQLATNDLGQGGYDPMHVEYDDELPEGETDEVILLSNDPEPKELGRELKIGMGKQQLDSNTIPDSIQEDDDIIDYFLNNNSNWVICEYFLNGNCKYGDKCKYMHPGSMKPSTSTQKKTIDGKIEGDHECVICLEKVLENGKKFGILENCSHVFCLDCIRDWRATYDKKIKKTHFRTCPICRENSYLVIPSTRMIFDGDLKEELIEEYTDYIAEIPCMHFNKGKGYCPFQNSCFYAHYLENGEWYEYPYKQAYIDEDGEMHDIGPEGEQQTLADRLGF